MKILKRETVSSDFWAEYKAIRRMIEEVGRHEIFAGKEDGVIVVLTKIDEDRYESTLIEIEWPSKCEELYVPSEETIREVVRLVES